jgi:nicotinamide phosphoribosyltransferase
MNPILLTDSYKLTHWRQYPPKTEKVYSYFESRGGRFPATVFFGLQATLLKYLTQRVTWEDIKEAEALTAQHLGSAELFNRAGWEHIFRQHEGRLPVAIKAVREGSVVPTHNVLMTIVNTDPECFWLPNYLETLLVQVWYPTTVASLSYFTKQVIASYLEQTSDTMENLPFKLHDFGFRGVSSVESAEIGGAAHLVNFMGTDTLPPLSFIRRFYKTDECAGFSIPASEHSTITSWGKDREVQAYANMLEQYPEGLVACVSDSYDIYAACEHLWGGFLAQRVKDRKGVLVVRPDSGNPTEVVMRCLNILGEKFGTVTNGKGYKLLHPSVRMIQGDGVSMEAIGAILQHMREAGWSADNLAFGMGGGLLQSVNRDTQKFAFKCSSVTIGGLDVPVWKEPKTDPGKNSKRGRLKLLKDPWRTVMDQEPGDDQLELVYRNGEITRIQDFANVREIAANG